MGFTIDVAVSGFAVFFQGLISFFSPCVLPLLPLYVGYFAGGAAQVDQAGIVRYPRRKMLVQTTLFVLGISAAFFLLGFGFTALGQFFQSQRVVLSRVSGVIMLLFGAYQLGLFGHILALERERRLPMALNGGLGALGALALGFTFSFAWTPCIGPILGSVLLMAGTADNAQRSAVLIALYTLGFVLPFFAVGLFTTQVLAFFKAHQSVVRYSVKLGGVVLIAMGVMTLTGLTSGLSVYLADNEDVAQPEAAEEAEPEAVPETAPETAPEAESEPAPAEAIPALAFTLEDQFGNTHIMEDYVGKTVFLNFWATWCPPCQGEMPDIQALYEAYGENTQDLIVLGVACPDLGQEGSAEDIATFLADAGYTFPVVMDTTGALLYGYGIQAFPTTYMIDDQGNIYGYVQSAVSGSVMEQIVTQTMDSTQETSS